MSTLWTPAEITTSLGLDASDESTTTLDGSGNVEQRDDKSGNGNHVSQDSESRRPGHSNDGDSYDGSNDALTVASRLGLSANPALTVAVVMTPVSVGINNSRIIQIGGAETGILSCDFGDSGVWSWRHNNGNRRFGPVTVNQEVIAIFHRPSGGDYSDGGFRLNGVDQSATSTGSGSTSPSATTEMTSIGSGHVDNLFDRPADLVIRELWVIPDDSLETIQNMEGFYAHKWDEINGNTDLVDELPAEHPYKSEAPKLPGVENVQATVLGTDSIEVTWDQFENDDSPPVAADGYEIEIDSGTPLDVGDNLTYPHLNLDPSTQYSYRVRGYYSGSPIEYTEWSETVQATTDAEELTTIPRKFVITAEIKLRDEAPEVEKPPLTAARPYINKNMVEYWPCDESSGDAVGVHAGNDLTAIEDATRTEDAKRGGNALHTNSVSGNSGSVWREAATGEQSISDAESKSFGLSFWSRLLEIPGSGSTVWNHMIASNWGGGTEFQFRLAVASTEITDGSTPGTVRLQIKDANENSITVGPNSDVLLADGQYHLYSISWDRDTGTAKLWVDAELIGESQSPMTAPVDLWSQHRRLGFGGGTNGSDSGVACDLYADEAIYLNAALEQGHVDWLYNFGDGRTYEEITG